MARSKVRRRIKEAANPLINRPTAISEVPALKGAGFSVPQSSAGQLVVITGQIIACDAFCGGGLPFPVTIPPGIYPVKLRSVEEAVAYAMVQISAAPTVRWEAVGSYDVDAGSGCFLDSYTAALLAEKTAHGYSLLGAVEAAYGGDADDEEYNGGDPLSYDLGEGLDFCIEKSTGANIILFRSGWGDGSYACHLGYGADGAVSALVTDFGVLPSRSLPWR